MVDFLIRSKIGRRIKQSDIFETLRHSQNYFLAQVVTQGLAFIAIPIFTRLFTQEDYGVIAVFQAYLAIFLIILPANVHSSVGRYYYEQKSDFGEFLGTALILTGLILLFNVFLFLLFFDPVTNILNLPGILPVFLILISFCTIFQSIYLQIIQAQKKSTESAIITGLSGTLSLILAILLIFLMKEDRYLGKIYATFIIGFIFSYYYLRKISHYANFSFKREHFSYILYFSIPLIPYALSSTIIAFFDRIMINELENTAAAGIYSLGYNIALIIALVITATQMAIIPDFYDFLNKKQYQRLNALVKKVFSIICFAAFGLILFAKEIIVVLVDKKFHDGAEIVPIVVIGYLFYGMFTVYGRYITYIKKTVYSSVIMIISGVVNVILNAIFIPQYGYIAAAYTTVVSYFLLFYMAWFVPKYVLKIEITPLWMIWKPFIILFCYFALYLVITDFISNLILLFVLKFIILTFFCFSVFYRELKLLVGS